MNALILTVGAAPAADSDPVMAVIDNHKKAMSVYVAASDARWGREGRESPKTDT